MNPEILTWARETAGLSREEAARAIELKDAYGKTGSERLAEFENGKATPSRAQLSRMAKAYRRSLLVFYLSAPPRTGDRGQDFRTVPGANPPLYDAELDALIRDIRRRQNLVRSLAEDSDSEPLGFVASANFGIDPDILAARLVTHIGFNLAEFRSQASPNAAFGYLRGRIESSGVFILLLGNLGSYHSTISVDVFRGFAIADPIAPFIVVNDQDTDSAWSFTALHELVHIWLGTTGLSGTVAATQIEQYCNDVAGEILLPKAELTSLNRLRAGSLAEMIGRLSNFAEERRISRSMVAYKLFRTGLLDRSTWLSLSAALKEQWLAAKQRQAEKQRGQEGGPNYYLVRRHRLGNALLTLVDRSLVEGSLTYTKAGQLLGVRPRNVDPLLRLGRQRSTQ